MDTCGSCGARLAPGIDWCPRCYAPIGSPDPADGVPQRIRLWYPSEKPVPPPVYSRIRGGTTTFGPVGRIGWTLAVVAGGAVSWFAFGPPPPFGLGLASSGWLPFFVLGPWVLRELWRRDRVG